MVFVANYFEVFIIYDVLHYNIDYTVHCTLYTINDTICTLNCTVYISLLYIIVYTVQYSLYLNFKYSVCMWGVQVLSGM